MKRKLTLTLATFLLYVVSINAQCNFPAPPGPSCQEAVFFCDGEIDGFCSTLGGTNGSVPSPLCPGGGVPNNIAWIAFAAGTTNITISVTPSNCQAQGNQMGVQAGIYGTCPAGGGDSPEDPVVCNANCMTNQFDLTSGAFVIGQVYFLFIDGCAGDICDYTLAVTNGSTSAPAPNPVDPIMGPLTTCQGQTGVIYSVPEALFASNYTWTVPAGATYTELNDLGNEIAVDFGPSGGQICVEASNDCNLAPNLECIDVVLIPTPSGSFSDTYCTGSAYNYYGTDYFAPGGSVTLPGASFDGCDSIVTFSLTEFALPPFDVYEGYCQGGFYYYPGDMTDYTQGTYNITFFGASYQGCDSTVILHVEEYLPTELNLEIAICQGEDYETCMEFFMDEGDYVYDCSPNFRGCDSTILLNLTVLAPFADIYPPDVIGCGVNTSIFLDGFGSDGDSFLWTTNDGDLCGDPTSPFTEVCAPGTYCLTATMSMTTVDQGLVECTDQQCVVVTSNSTPPMSSNTSTNIGCNGDTDGTATITVSNTAIGPFTYDWTPNVSTTNTAANLPAGTYTVVVTAASNACTSTEVIEITEPTAIAIATSQTNVLCNGSATGSATATPSGGTGPFTYLWCNGQTTATATGLPVGPCTVVVTDNNSCTQTASVTLTEPTPVAVSITPSNVLCNGTSTGSATANPSGGTGPYTYLWCNSQTTQTATSLPAGSCTVVVTDANNCSITESVTLVEPSAIELTTSQTNVLCNGDMNGTATVTPSGGLGPYTYLWCNNQTTQTATGLGVGQCNVVVTDANGCTNNTSVDLTAPNPMTLSTTQMNVQCDGGTDGTGTAVPSGGTGPYSYLWCNGQTAPTATNLPVGTCSVVVTDANGCTQMDEVILTAPPALTVTTAQTDILCNGGNDGTGTATPAGGNGPYTYQWCNGQSTATATGLTLGTCQVIVTDANGCTQSASVDIAETSAISVSITSTNVLCNGENSGTATATPSGGAGGFTYSWCNGETTATANGLPAGACLVVVTDANGCSETESVTLTEPSAVNVSASETDLSCFGANDGTATASGSGGAGAFTYLWCNGQTTAMATDLPAGACSVVVTDANGCTNSTTVNPEEPDELVLAVSSQDITCFGEANGTATVTPSGGTGTYSYMWCNGQGTATAIGLDVGPCSVVVTDGNGCSETTSVDLTQPASALDITGTSQNATCGQDDGSISITVTGGTTPYDYDWNDPAPDVQNPSNLGPGNYTVVVTDGNDCTASFTIGVMTPSGLDASAAWTNVSCNGGNDGTITVTVNGGTSPYDYDWDSPLINQDSPTGTDLPADGYNVTVTDADGCTFVTSAAVEEPDVIEITGNATDEICGESNGTISTSVQGGTGPYTYVWSNGDGTANIQDLPAGNYILDLTDANGCAASFDISVNTPNALAVSSTSVNVSCAGGDNGSIDLTVTGGVPPFGYVWDNAGPVPDPSNLTAGIYNVVVTDDTGCSIVSQVEITEPTQLTAVNIVQQATCGNDNGGVSLTASGGTSPYTYLWSNGDTSDNPTGLPPGTIIVTVTDDNGCEIVETIEVDTPPAISLNVSSTMTSCFQGADGTIDLTVNGGTAPFSYVWTGGSIDQDPTGLAPGMYSVVVTDANDCTEETSITIGEPTEITITGSTTNATCGDTNGTVSISASGGTPPYTYAWTGTTSTEPNPTDLGPGNYCVVVTDDNGCTNTACYDVETPDGLALTTDVVDINCFGDATGTIDLEVMGGIGPFTYLWDTGDTDPDLSGLPAGVYEVLVTDDETGCTIITSATIIQPDAIAISGNELQSTCGESNGSISLTVGGGTGPYTYLWSPSGSTDQNPTGLDPIEHTVEVTDFNGCTETYSIFVTTAPELTSSAIGTDISCFGGTDGIVDITVVGGTLPYSYIWSNGSTNEDPSDFPAGPVTGTVTDLNGCVTEVNLVLGEPEAIGVTSTTTDETCGESNGSISLTVTGGTLPFSYAWTPSLPDTPNPTDLVVGTYCVDITDANGCVFNYCTDVTTPNELVLSTVISDAACNGAADGFIDLSISGGVGPFAQLWTPGGWNGEDLIDIPAGTYTVVVTDATDCTATVTEVIAEPTLIEITGTSTEALCNQNNGSIDITVTGGTGNYTYLWTPGNITDEDPNNLGIGNYTVVVTDVNNCSQTFEIGVQTPSGLELVPTAFDANCNGASDGNVDLQVNGGTSPFVYNWMPNGETTEDLTDVPAGTYNVLVTDADGCTIVASAIVGEPDAIIVTGNATDETCNLSNGTITTSVTGGTGGPYTYAWTPSGSTDANPTGLLAVDHTVMVTDGNGCTGTMTITVDAPNALTGGLTATNISCDSGTDGEISAAIFGGSAPYSYVWTPNVSSGPIASDLPVGTYTLVVTDADNCTYTLTETLTAPPLLEVTASPTQATCGDANGTIDLVATGGAGGYQYQWTPSQPNTPNLTNLFAGSYSCVVTDANGCTVEITSVVDTPDMLELSAQPTDADCFAALTGSATSNVIGGTGSFSYLWMPGGSTDQNPTGLGAATYTLVVTDDVTGCTETVVIEINEPDGLAVSDVPTSATCGDSNGATNLTVSGGTEPYNYIWNTGATMQNLSAVPAGDYFVTITDSSGCPFEFATSIGGPPQALSANVLGPTSIACNGDQNGSANLEVSGGTAPYTYLWTPSGETTANPVFLVAGDNSVLVTDALGCTASEVVTLTEPAALVLSAESFPTLCGNGSDGSIDLTVSGGTLPYTYAWSNASTDEDPNGLSAGAYVVVVTDDNGCTITLTTNVNEPEEVAVVITNVSEFSGFNLSCETSEDGSAEAVASGGVAPYSYQWDNGTNQSVMSGVAAGTYSVMVTDANGCTGTSQVSLEAPEGVSVSFFTEDVSCFGDDDGAVFVDEITGGAPPYRYAIDGGELSQFGLFGNLTGGQYEITIQDANGCVNTQNVIVNEPAQIVVSLGSDQVIQLGEEPFDIEALVNIGVDSTVLQYWEWTQGRFFTENDTSRLFTEREINPLETTLYEFLVIDTTGCVALDQMLVTVTKDRKVYIPNAFSPNGDGNNDKFYIQSSIELEKVNTFKIYNRWGEVVFELSNFFANDPNNGWDGTFKGETLNQAVFVFYAEVEFKDGRIEILQGDVTLLK